MFACGQLVRFFTLIRTIIHCFAFELKTDALGYKLRCLKVQYEYIASRSFYSFFSFTAFTFLYRCEMMFGCAISFFSSRNDMNNFLYTKFIVSLSRLFDWIVRNTVDTKNVNGFETRPLWHWISIICTFAEKCSFCENIPPIPKHF